MEMHLIDNARLSSVEKTLAEILAKVDAIKPEGDVIGGLEMAMSVTGLKKADLYKKTSKKIIPHYKKYGTLFFSKKELLAWILSGKVKSIAELKTEAMETILSRNKKRMVK